MTNSPTPGWYIDPSNPAIERYWSGTAWSQEIRPSSPPTTPPLPAPLAPPFARLHDLAWKQRMFGAIATIFSLSMFFAMGSSQQQVYNRILGTGPSSSDILHLLTLPIVMLIYTIQAWASYRRLDRENSAISIAGARVSQRWDISNVVILELYGAFTLLVAIAMGFSFGTFLFLIYIAIGIRFSLKRRRVFWRNLAALGQVGPRPLLRRRRMLMIGISIPVVAAVVASAYAYSYVASAPARAAVIADAQYLQFLHNGGNMGSLPEATAKALGHSACSDFAAVKSLDAEQSLDAVHEMLVKPLTSIDMPDDQKADLIDDVMWSAVDVYCQEYQDTLYGGDI